MTVELGAEAARARYEAALRRLEAEEERATRRWLWREVYEVRGAIAILRRRAAEEVTR